MNKKDLFWRVGLAVVLAIILVMPGAVPVGASPQADPGINKVYVDFVTNGDFMVSWTTNLASDGSITWGTSKPPTNVVNDSVTNTTTHYVEVHGLSASTTYYFKVTSGTAEDNNGGAYYQVTTGPIINPRTPLNLVWGYVYQSNGSTVVPNAIVYLQLQDMDGSGSQGNSQWVSARADGAGVWSVELANIRTADLTAYYTWTAGVDKLRVVGQGGSAGTRGADPNPWTVTTPTIDTTQLDVILQGAPTAVKMVGLSAYNAGPAKAAPFIWLGLIGLAAVVSGTAWFWLRKTRDSKVQMTHAGRS